MKYLAILAIVLLATKKIAEFALAFFCVLLFGYGSWVLVRDFRTSAGPDSSGTGRTA